MTKRKIPKRKIIKQKTKQIQKQKKTSKKKETHLKEFLLYFSLIAIVLFIVSQKTGPINDKLVQHRYVWDPNTYLYGISPMQKAIEREKPKFILLGNSTLRQGIIGKEFNELTKVPTQRVFFGGSSAPWWYLTIKNVITKAKHKPQKLAIFFWGNSLTDTKNGAKGKYQAVLDMTSLPDEPLIDRLTFLDQMSDEAFFMSKKWSIYQKRNEMKASFDSYVKMKVGNWFGIEENYVDTAIIKTFADNNMNKELFDKKMIEELNYNNSKLFKNQVENSYLPEIIRLVKESGIELMFVRVKKRSSTSFEEETEEMQKYILDLKKYAEKNAVHYLSFAYDNRLEEDCFSDASHLNAKGQDIFTKIFAEKVNPYIADMKIDTIPLIRDLGM